MLPRQSIGAIRPLGAHFYEAAWRRCGYVKRARQLTRSECRIGPLMTARIRIPLTDAVIFAVARLVDDSQTGTREPSHSAIESQIDRAGLAAGDPNRSRPDRPVGKEKRVREVLSWALETDLAGGERLVFMLLTQVRALGGFRRSSPNYVGEEPIANLASVLHAEGLVLSSAGDIQPLLLDALSGAELTAALEAYIRRAMRGAEDAALVTGTGKDLLEATAAHVLHEVWGGYSTGDNFPTLLGQAFSALGLATPQDAKKPDEQPHRMMERGLYDLACGINRLRNKQGTGHGRPFLASVTPEQAKTAIESMGVVAQYLLSVLKKR